MAQLFERLSIPGVWHITSDIFPDRRGFFRELYKASEFSAVGLPSAFAQDNLSHSVQGVLRGLHYQAPPHAQGKLVSVVSGTILDVAVDLRHGSPWYGQHISQTLSGDDGGLLYVPEGFAHGFLVLSEYADVLYKVTTEFVPTSARHISWSDPDLAVTWPIDHPILSAADAVPHRLRDTGRDFVFEPSP